MRVTFATEELKKRLGQLGSVVSKKAPTPVYAFIRLFAYEAAVDGQVTYRVGMSGVDITASLTVTLTKATVDGPVDVLLPLARLVEIVSAITSNELVIESDGETKATVKAGKYKAELRTCPLANWPPILDRPETALAAVGLPGLKTQIQQVEFAVPTEAGKYVVTVAKVESTPEFLRLVGTDGFRLAISQVPQNVGQFDLVLPRTALELIKKLEGATITISEAEGGFYFDTELETLTVSRSHGEFPPYARTIPKADDVKTVITVKKRALDEALRRARPLADPEKPIVRFATGEKELVVDATHDESTSEGSVFRNASSDEIEAVVTGPAAQFSLDVSLLQPFVSLAFGTGDGDIVIKFCAANKIIDFHANAEQFRFLQMPTKAVVQNG